MFKRRMLHIAHDFIREREIGFYQRLDDSKIRFIASDLHLQAKNRQLILRQPFIFNDLWTAEKIALKKGKSLVSVLVEFLFSLNFFSKIFNMTGQMFACFQIRFNLR